MPGTSSSLLRQQSMKNWFPNRVKRNLELEDVKQETRDWNFVLNYLAEKIFLEKSRDLAIRELYQKRQAVRRFSIEEIGIL